MRKSDAIRLGEAWREMAAGRLAITPGGECACMAASPQFATLDVGAAQGENRGRKWLRRRRAAAKPD
jgi:hypothetical protein